VSRALEWLASWVRRGRGASAADARSVASLLGEPGFLALDLETTGLSARRDAIVSAAVVPFVSGVAGRPLVDTLANPGRPIPPLATGVHRVSDSMVLTAPPAATVAALVLEACAAHVVVGYRIAFDLAIVNRYRRVAGLPRFTGAAIDVAALARSLAPGIPSASLEALAIRFGIPPEDRHSARGDAVIAGRIFLAILGDLERHGARTIQEIRHLQWTNLRIRDTF
jgi:DNA polymerase III epsilon subunit-like protein